MSDNGEVHKDERVAISKRLRFEVFKRDGFTCQYCGAHPPGVLLHCDHIDPVANGGLTEIDNLVAACEACNLGKSSIPLNIVPERLSERAARTIEMESQIAGYQAVMKDRRMRLEADAEEVLDMFCSWFHRKNIPQRDFLGIKNFVERIGVDETVEAVDIARAKFPYSYARAFRYFCGVCWNRIRQATEG